MDIVLNLISILIGLVIIYSLYRVVRKQSRLEGLVKSDLDAHYAEERRKGAVGTIEHPYTKDPNPVLPKHNPAPVVNPNPYGKGDTVSVILKGTAGMADSKLTMIVLEASNGDVHLQAEDMDQESLMRSIGYDIPVIISYKGVELINKAQNDTGRITEATTNVGQSRATIGAAAGSKSIAGSSPVN